LGVCISWWLQHVAVFEVESLCPWCFVSAVTVTLIFLFSTYNGHLAGRTLEGEQKLLFGVGGAILLLLGFTYVPALSAKVITLMHGPSVRVIPPQQIEDMRKVLLTPEMHTTGDPRATYTLVEFADYLCPACKEASKRLEPLLQSTGKPIRLAFRN